MNWSFWKEPAPPSALDTLTDQALDQNWPQVFKHLASEGLGMEGDDDHDPLLVIAVSQNQELEAMRLVKMGANPNARSLEGRPVLVLAIEQCADEMAIALLDAGADPNTTTPSGTSALSVAARKGKCEMLVCLHRAGARADTRAKKMVLPSLSRIDPRLMASLEAVGLVSSTTPSRPTPRRMSC